jgi:nucleoside-diphosphate-sugar epimerase
MRNKIIEEDLEFIINQKLPWEKIAGKSILISGANGFLPAYMVETLLYINEKKYFEPAQIIILVRNREKASKRFAEYIGGKNLKIICQDVCEPVALPSDTKIDYIIHAASQASPKYYGIDPVGTLSANIIGVKNLLDLAKRKDSENFLFFSSGEVYGELDQSQIPVKENIYGYVDPLDVRSCYAQSKRMGENMCVSWYHQYGIPAKIVRPFHTYGPGMALDDGRVFADFVANIVNNQDITLNSDGCATRAFCYLADAIIGFFTVLFKGTNATAYNVGNDQCEISIRNLAELLVSLFPEKKLKVKLNTKQDSQGYLKSKITRNCPDITKMQFLGWKPNFTLEEGFERTVRSYLI